MQVPIEPWCTASHATMALAQHRGREFISHRHMDEAADRLARELGESLVSSTACSP